MLSLSFEIILSLQIAWYLEDTSQSLAMLADGTVDITVTYAAAEKHSIDCSAAVRDVIVFKVSYFNCIIYNGH
jgi:hypothetical protein